MQFQPGLYGTNSKQYKTRNKNETIKVYYVEDRPQPAITSRVVLVILFLLRGQLLMTPTRYIFTGKCETFSLFRGRKRTEMALFSALFYHEG